MQVLNPIQEVDGDLLFLQKELLRKDPFKGKASTLTFSRHKLQRPKLKELPVDAIISSGARSSQISKYQFILLIKIRLVSG